MRRLATISAAAALLAGAAQSIDAQQAQVSATQKAVFALEEEWTRALVNVDTAAFKRITAPGLVYTEDNVVMNQRELINAVVNGDKVEWAGNEEMKLYDYHPVAIVTGILVTKGKNKKGEAFENRYRYTDTWLYRDGRWQVIAAQDYLIPK
jgi:ketosteroid isomerase-like protein